jgi:hypothetical protein
MPAVIGCGLVAAHAVLLPVALHRCRRDSLRVRVTAPPAAPSLSVSAELPRDVFDRVRVFVDDRRADLETADPGPGIHRVEWSVGYRGDFERRVGLAQLVGPFQDPAHPPCSVRLLVGQAFLDDGNAGPGTVAHLAKQVAESEFEGFEQWPIGEFREVSRMSLSWVSLWDDFLTISVELAFSNGRVPITLALRPRLEGGAIKLDTAVAADVDIDGRVYQWIADLFDADDIAAATAEEEIEAALRNAFTPPPPVPLPGGRELRFEYCPGEEIEIVTGRYAAIPLALRLDGARPDLLPVYLGRAARAGVVETRAPLALEFELDAINAILYYLWRTGFLDQELDDAGIDERFNENSIVRELLSIRVGDILLSLPPTAKPGSATERSFELGAEATLMIRDGDTHTPARVFSTIGFDFVGGDSAELVAKLALRELALTCEPEPGLLEPCYSDLVEELRSHSDDLHGELTRLFTRKFNEIVLHEELGTDEMMATFAIDRAEVHAQRLPPTGIIRVDLFGRLHCE